MNCPYCYGGFCEPVRSRSRQARAYAAAGAAFAVLGVCFLPALAFGIAGLVCAGLEPMESAWHCATCDTTWPRAGEDELVEGAL